MTWETAAGNRLSVRPSQEGAPQPWRAAPRLARQRATARTASCARQRKRGRACRNATQTQAGRAPWIR
eukprot:1605881-Pyramimonas_sp.AAC.1